MERRYGKVRAAHRHRACHAMGAHARPSSHHAQQVYALRSTSLSEQLAVAWLCCAAVLRSWGRHAGCT